MNAGVRMCSRSTQLVRQPASPGRDRSGPSRMSPLEARQASCWRRPAGTAPAPRPAARAGCSRCRGRPRRTAWRSATGGRRSGAAAVVRREAGERARQLLAAGADHAGDAENLAGVELEIDVPVGAGERQPLGLEQRPCRGRASAAARGSIRPAGRVRPSAGAASRTSASAACEVGDHLAVLHDVDAVAESSAPRRAGARRR